jgi:hypothetical protein
LTDRYIFIHHVDPKDSDRETEEICETLVFSSTLKRLIAREDFSASPIYYLRTRESSIAEFRMYEESQNYVNKLFLWF